MTNPYDQTPSNEDPFGLQGGQGYPYNSGYSQNSDPGNNQHPKPTQPPSYGSYQNHYPNQSAGYGAQLGQEYQPGVGRTAPDNWLWATIVITIMCCSPVAAVGIYFSSQVEGRWEQGDYAGAKSASDTARNLALAGAVVTCLMFITYVVVMVVFVGKALDEVL